METVSSVSGGSTEHYLFHPEDAYHYSHCAQSSVWVQALMAALVSAGRMFMACSHHVQDCDSGTVSTEAP